jgi:hypothetical protein
MDMAYFPRPTTIKLAITSTLVAMALATNYALIWLPNVKLMDSIVFFTAYAFGFIYGAIAAVTIWLIYGIFNPYGFNLLTLIMVITGEFFYVLFALLLRKFVNPVELIKRNGNLMLIAFFALISTLLYDIYTNALVGLIWYNSIWLGLLTMNFPYPFGIMHQISNTVLMPIIVSAGVYILYLRGVIHG